MNSTGPTENPAMEGNETPREVATLYLRSPLFVFGALLLVAGILALFGARIALPENTKPIIAMIFLTAAVVAALIRGALHRNGVTERDVFEAAASVTVSPREAPVGEKAASGSQGLVSLSLTDKLTGLGNRMRMQAKFNTLEADYRESPESRRKGFAIGLVDINGMKPINDLFGISGGDDVIRQCSQRLRSALEGKGFVYRYEGDVFAFVLPGMVSHKEVEETGKLLQEVIQAPFDIAGCQVRLSGSFGFGIYPEAGRSFEAVQNNLGSALYHSKRNGRGRVTLYCEELERTIRENTLLEQSLRRAIENNEISPHFQPIISLKDGSLLGFEALARWIDAELGFVSPAKFIPLAEERGIISRLTDTLLEQAARTAADWPDDLFLSFNLSSVQLIDSNAAQQILTIIEKAGLPPQRLEIEVTETAMMADPVIAAQIIEDLHQAGVRVSMDDFGTGQSSLGRLRELKLDKVKIDRSFIMAIGDDRPAQHIVRAILEMCAGLDLAVVAEGIEEIGQAENLKRFGCDAGQGYLFGKPQDAHTTMNYIREFRRVPHSDRDLKIA